MTTGSTRVTCWYGLMGVVADAVLAAGGEVVGVIPHTLMEREIGHTGVTRLHVVDSMHERKALMADLSDGFVALPGGWGTLEELFEVLTWASRCANVPCLTATATPLPACWTVWAAR